MTYNISLLHTGWIESTMCGNTAPNIPYAHPLDDNECVPLVKL